jgi:hypothetical protein
MRWIGLAPGRSRFHDLHELLKIPTPQTHTLKQSVCQFLGAKDFQLLSITEEFPTFLKIDGSY